MKNLMHAAAPLANDLFTSLLFAVLIVAGVDPRTATLIAVAVGVGHVLLMLALRRPIAPLQWAGLALVMTLGTLGFFLRDARFLMVKPTVIYAILTVMMLKRGWMLRYMPPIARGHGEPLMIRFGYVWAGLMAVMAAANMIIAVAFPAIWPAYTAIFPLASKLALFAIQFLTIRAYVKPKVKAEMAQA